ETAGALRDARARRPRRRARGLRTGAACARRAGTGNGAVRPMNNRVSSWFPIVLLLLLAALTYWLDLTVNEFGGAHERASGSDPDFIVDNFRITKTNASGLTDY